MKKLTSVVLSILMVISMLSCLFVGSVSAEEANNSVTAAEIYDISGKKIDNEQTYTNVTTAVNGEEVTATVEYDKDSGAYFFLGWYDETGAKVSADEAYTFTPAEGKIYTPRIGSANLIGGSGSFENYENSESLAVALPTGISSVNDITADNIPNFSGDNKWATNENAGYLGSTWPETIYDKDYNSYQQVATYRLLRVLNTFKVVEDATIAKSGRKYLHIKGGGASSLGLENLNKNTDYKLSFYLRYSDFNANKIKSVGVTTTVNINNDQWNKDATLNSQGMLITLENAVPSHKITVAKCDSTELSKVSTTEWQKITVDFNSGNLEKLYLAIVSTNGAELNYYIDDMVLVKAGDANSVSAANVEFHDANGGAVDSSNEYAKADIIGNFDGTYTAKVAYDKDNGAYAFKGWYYDGELANVGELFDINAETYPDVSLFKAVITSANLLPEAASFENYKSQTILTYTDNEASEGGLYPAPTSTKWGTATAGKYFEDNHFKIHTVYGQYEVPCYNKDANTYVKKSFNAHSGNSMLRINTHSRSAISALERLTPNTDYTLTFYVLGTSSVDYLSAVGVAVRYDDYYLNIANADTEGSVAVKKLEYAEGWQKVELSFNSGENDTLYLHLYQQAKTGNVNQGGSFIDDLSLIAMPKVDVQFVDVKGNDITSSCANEAKPNITNSTTKPGYFVATANYESDAFEFKGWYDGDTLVSAEKSFEFANGKYQSLTAKVVSRNTLKSTASYEGYNAGTSLVYTDKESYPSGAYFGGNKNAGYLGQTKVETIYDNQGNSFEQKVSGDKTTATNGVKATVTNVKAHSGKNSVLLENNFWTASLGIDVKPNTDYVLSYYVLAPKYLDNQTVNTIERSAISTTVNTGGNSNAVAPANVSLNSATKLYLDDIILKDKHDGENWIKVTHTFNSMNLDKVYLVICQTSIGGKPSSWAYIDDLTCYKTNLTAEDLGINTTTDMKYNGSSIRAYATEDKPQALRHKFEIKKSLINDNIALYGELVEYGSVAIRTDYLGGKELVKDGVYTYNDTTKKAVTGVAYQKDAEGNVTTNKIFQDTGESIVFTAALIGIGKTGSGTNYVEFGNKYSVRNYLIFRNGTKETIVYTETQSYSVFDVMKAIEDTYVEQNSSGIVDEKVKADYNTIQSIFSKIPAQETEYNNWKNSQNS